LAQADGCRWMSDPRVARRIVEILRAGESQKEMYQLQAWAVMPNHVHILILPHVALPQITHWIKGRSAYEANLLLGRTGAFWQDEKLRSLG